MKMAKTMYHNLIVTCKKYNQLNKYKSVFFWFASLLEKALLNPKETKKLPICPTKERAPLFYRVVFETFQGDTIVENRQFIILKELELC